MTSEGYITRLSKTCMHYKFRSCPEIYVEKHIYSMNLWTVPRNSSVFQQEVHNPATINVHFIFLTLSNQKRKAR